MEPSLLATKTEIPQLPSVLVARQHLVDDLERQIPAHRVTLISAPAGYGKSTLLVQWARSSRCQIAWLSLDKDDSEFDRFFRYLLSAWEKVRPEVMDTPLGMLLGGIAPPEDAVVPAFINLAGEGSTHTVFILDDFHLLAATAVEDTLSDVIAYLPPTVHFVLATRTTPALPLAHYRARRQLWEVNAARLAFQPDETAEFLDTMTGLDLAGAVVQEIQARVQGWVAGLQLVALTLRSGLLESTHDLHISGQHRFIADFFKEVLAALSGEIQMFLLRTSILERLCGPLCNAVTGDHNGQEMLEEVERLNLFLQPLDARREWFRYHPLFADFLRSEAAQRGAGTVDESHRRAARYYLQQELPDQAFAHALACGDVELVLLVFEKHAQTKLLAGEFRLVQRWLNALPGAWRAAYPLFGLVESCLLFFTGQFEASARTINEVERRLQPAGAAERRAQLAQVQAVRCSLACFKDNLPQAEAFAAQASRNLAAGDNFFRAIVFGSLGDTYRRHALWDKARTCYLQLLPSVRDRATSLQAAHVYGALADLELRQGHLQDAAGYWRRASHAIQQRENWGHLPLPLTGWIYIRAAELLYERDDLTAAANYLSKGSQRAEMGGDLRAMLAGHLLSSRLSLTAGDIAGTAEYLEQARPLVERVQDAQWPNRFKRLQLELWLAQDKMRAVAKWCDSIPQEAALVELQDDENARLAQARALIALGGRQRLEQAQALLNSLLPAAESAGRTGVTIEGLALRALAMWTAKDEAGAMIALERALYLAQSQGYVHRLTDLGPPMRRLLQEAYRRKIWIDYVESLLEVLADTASPPGDAPKPLPEPLTKRELEILNLLAAGLTNREIGQQLTISPLTVKTHASRIYGKLGVHGRTEAAARARELNLLE